MAVLGQAGLNLNSPDHSAAQVLAFMHGPEAEYKENRPAAAAKGEDDGDTSMEDMPLATVQDSDRYGVVKIVWTAEEDQQLLQVRPRMQPAPLAVHRIAHGMGTAHATEGACAPIT
jgi:hypothetical protein